MNVFTVITIFLFQVAVVICKQETDKVPSVTTKIGTIIGTTKNVKVFGKQMNVERYQGIPYAEPPTGELRFSKPVEKKPFSAPFHATKPGNICFQLFMIPTGGSTVSEDCLVLNLFVPAERKESLPVIVHFHGGGFITGSSNYALADTLALHGEVIVVTVSYRLSLWGFLSTSDEQAPGNYGLWDQHLAIKWVHNNILAFGGDPSKVTIIGESAGAISVVVQSLYEGNKGLFQNAIAQSGSITIPTLALDDPKNAAEKLGKLVGCENAESGPLITCLRGVTAATLNETLNDFSNGLFTFPMPFVLSVDGEFVKEHPKAVLLSDTGTSSAGREFFSTVNFMSGIDAEEGIVMFGAMLGITDLENFKPNRTFYEENFIPMFLSLIFGPDPSDALKELFIQDYTDWTDPDDLEKRLHKLTAIISDFIFSVPLLETVSRHESLAEGRKGTYIYMFDIAPSSHALPTPSWVTRPTHCDELLYIFFDESGGILRYLGKEDFIPQPWEYDVAKYMINVWANFAKTGNPNKPTPVQMFWPPYTKETQQYLHMTRNMTSESVKSYLLALEFNLWTKVIPSVKQAINEAGSHATQTSSQDYCDKEGSCPP